MQRTPMREKCSQQSARGMGRQDMFYGTVQIGRRGQGRQKHSMRGRWRRGCVGNVEEITTGSKGAPQ